MVHLLAEQGQHDIGVLLDRAQVTEVVEIGSRVRARGVEARQLRDDQQRNLPLQGERLEAAQHQRDVLVLDLGRAPCRRGHQL